MDGASPIAPSAYEDSSAEHAERSHRAAVMHMTCRTLGTGKGSVPQK